ncbi:MULTISPECIES: Gx transporter family protein [unclassified Candidatus Frackibacter]|uniref:Gx transporter family protein n=1 Tax=unclassified Candidatus Frackibacter TaxID=2648818 RepID=UPI00079C28CB|nr:MULTISPECIES: Gx transporter family protein [unclassified Candidatus Frackibacter]KXS36684.1 MAG: heptaprenyl diphosphate synthase [Candidatus Frackibacter sp. T328-2]SDC40727.1 heptaprenyl diphosphate synthase [Candidatus Frackibacter sp. WG11]SEM60107.1 heptaprenyl diphosphate synthase [Candidatus Frackibacter sp. WG12]SFL61935.1 heptaprenyl diphosphate synthase [Candidatus Frackibacter sp. WG13]
MIEYKRLLYISLFASLAVVVHMIEALIPTSIIVPGAKLGLSNIMILLSLVLFGYSAGFQVLLLRTIISSFLIGTFMTTSFYLSLAGGLLSFTLMALAYKYLNDKFSLIGVSLLGAVAHNVGQILVAYLIIDNWGIIYYLPYLLLFALPTGIFIGLAVIYLEEHLRLNL